MRILLFSNLYRPEPTGVGPMSGELADALIKAGHEVHVIAANPSYPDWKLFAGFSAWRWSCRDEAGVIVHRVPVFIPRKVRGLTRILHYSSFALAALFPAVRLSAKYRPDLVIFVAPTLIAAPVVLLCARLASARTWLHVQDFEVEAGFATGELGGGPIAKAALVYERAVLRNFDRASSISPEMCAKLIDKGCDAAAVFELRNWADIDGIVPRESSPYRGEFAITTPHVLLYSGALAAKQGLKVIPETARLLADRVDLTFVVCGSGPAKAMLERAATELPNLRVFNLQPKERLGELLALATIHLLPQRSDAADLVLPSKLANMLASGRPVIAGTEQGAGLAREVEGAGLACQPESAAALAEAIVKLVDNPEARERMGKTAREHAVARWSRQHVLERFMRDLSALVGRAAG
jgi:colanic acid biosynthesis glycosyl transferase WcaI